MSRLQNILDQIIAQLRTFEQVERIVLFGSRARNDAEERSDIDIAIDADADQRLWFQIEDILEEADTLLSFDLTRLNEASDNLRRRIETEGTVLYERNKE